MDAFDLQDELLASREWKVVARIEAFGRSVRLLERNAEELGRAIRHLTQDQCTMLLEGPELGQWLEEIERLLHNVVAAAKTLVDHSRKLNKDLYGDIPAEYERRVRSLADNPVVPFVHKLRDFFVHWKLPPVAYVEHDDENGMTRSIALSRDDLLTWSEWKQAHRFLRGFPEDIEVGTIFDQYLALIRQFHEWFAARLEEVHAADYAAVNTKLATIAQLRTGGQVP